MEGGFYNLNIPTRLQNNMVAMVRSLALSYIDFVMVVFIVK
jgi:hypothetical protein